MAGRTIYGEDATQPMKPNIETEKVLGFWQHNAQRMLRANECILRGLMSATRRELELSQGLMSYNIEKLQGSTIGAGSDIFKKPNIDRNINELENFVSGMREVSEGLQQCFAEATKLLFEGSMAEANEAIVEPVRKNAQQAEATVKRAVGTAVSNVGRVGGSDVR